MPKTTKNKSTKRSKKKSGRCWKGYAPVKGKKKYSKGSCKKTN